MKQYINKRSLLNILTVSGLLAVAGCNDNGGGNDGGGSGGNGGGKPPPVVGSLTGNTVDAYGFAYLGGEFTGNWISCENLLKVTDRQAGLPSGDNNYTSEKVFDSIEDVCKITDLKVMKNNLIIEGEFHGLIDSERSDGLAELCLVASFPLGEKKAVPRCIAQGYDYLSSGFDTEHYVQNLYHSDIANGGENYIFSYSVGRAEYFLTSNKEYETSIWNGETYRPVYNLVTQKYIPPHGAVLKSWLNHDNHLIMDNLVEHGNLRALYSADIPEHSLANLYHVADLPTGDRFNPLKAGNSLLHHWPVESNYPTPPFDHLIVDMKGEISPRLHRFDSVSGYSITKFYEITPAYAGYSSAIVSLQDVGSGIVSIENETLNVELLHIGSVDITQYTRNGYIAYQIDNENRVITAFNMTTQQAIREGKNILDDDLLDSFEINDIRLYPSGLRITGVQNGFITDYYFNQVNELWSSNAKDSTTISKTRPVPVP